MKEEVKRSKTLRKFWQEKLEEWERSGLSGSAWCRKNQLSYYQFNYWRNIFISKSSPLKSLSVAQEDFIEIKEEANPEERTFLTINFCILPQKSMNFFQINDAERFIDKHTPEDFIESVKESL